MGADDSGWASLFWEAFKQSRNPMVLLDERRCFVDINGAYLQLVDHARTDLLGCPVYQFDANGFQVCAAMTSRRDGPAVLLVTADPDLRGYAVLKQSGARGLVAKADLAAADLGAFWPRP